MTAHTKIEHPLAEVCRDYMAKLVSHMARSGDGPGNWRSTYVGSIYSVQRWIDACQEALTWDDFSEVRDMMERDGWDIGEADETGTIDQRVPPVGAVA